MDEQISFQSIRNITKQIIGQNASILTRNQTWLSGAVQTLNEREITLSNVQSGSQSMELVSIQESDVVKLIVNNVQLLPLKQFGTNYEFEFRQQAGNNYMRKQPQEQFQNNRFNHEKNYRQENGKRNQQYQMKFDRKTSQQDQYFSSGQPNPSGSPQRHYKQNDFSNPQDRKQERQYYSNKYYKEGESTNVNIAEQQNQNQKQIKSIKGSKANQNRKKEQGDVYVIMRKKTQTQADQQNDFESELSQTPSNAQSDLCLNMTTNSELSPEPNKERTKTQKEKLER